MHTDSVQSGPAHPGCLKQGIALGELKMSHSHATGRRTPAQAFPITNAARMVDLHSDAIAANAKRCGVPRTDLARMGRHVAPSIAGRILRAIGL